MKSLNELRELVRGSVTEVHFNAVIDYMQDLVAQHNALNARVRALEEIARGKEASKTPGK